MSSPDLSFVYDLGSPYAYLAAERIETVLGRAVSFQPILLGAIFGERGFGSWSQTPDRAAGMAEVERRAAVYGLPPIRWPEAWPTSMLAAMRASTYATSRGRGREFALAAFRAAFVDGRDLSQLAVIDEVAQAVGLEGVRTIEELSNPRIKRALVDATSAAWAAGVRGVPTVLANGIAYYGDDQLDRLADELGSQGLAAG